MITQLKGRKIALVSFCWYELICTQMNGNQFSQEKKVKGSKPSIWSITEGEVIMATINLSLLEHDCGEAAREALLSGVPVYYADETTPENCVIKEYPDGRRELVSFMTGMEKLVGANT
ncbi:MULTISPECIES: hypothetical protein [Enterobacterales]|jgi:hypothetical protein|nr:MULTISPECIES: hypothetical protein [Enterobacterales]MCA7141155.1 hypothetical protein [Escherichia coli]MCA7636786.1 hypothetical protein [Escherichia coli]MCE3708056.1 hypothetical protein [Escherichia coli]MCE3817774.1 hypothetical protein [Escherichia coli]MCE3881771.1 hypothetical protein [Escherichia coli]